jgi:outer membrane immunogenic protein
MHSTAHCSTSPQAARSATSKCTAGLGVEYAILGPWSAKVEYLYADLGDATCGAATCGIDTTVSFKTSIVRLGVNYRFW